MWSMTRCSAVGASAARRSAAATAARCCARSRPASGPPRGSPCAARASTWSAARDAPAARSSRIPAAPPSGRDSAMNTPSQIRLVSCGLERLRLGDIVLGVVGRPADRGRRVVVVAAGMDADRQADAARRRRRSASSGACPAACRRSPAAAPARSAGRRRSARSRRPRVRRSAAAPRCDARSRRSRSSHSRGHPVVHRAGEGGRHVLAEQQLHAVEAVADARCRCRTGRGTRRRTCSSVAAGLPFGGPPVRRARVSGELAGIADRVQLIHAAGHDHVLPVARPDRAAAPSGCGTVGWMSQSTVPVGSEQVCVVYVVPRLASVRTLPCPGLRRPFPLHSAATAVRLQSEASAVCPAAPAGDGACRPGANVA